MQPPATIPHMWISGGNIWPPATSKFYLLINHLHQQLNAGSPSTLASIASPTIPLSMDGDAVKASCILNGAPVVNRPTSNGNMKQTLEKTDIQQPISLPLSGHSPNNGYAIPNGAFMLALDSLMAFWRNRRKTRGWRLLMVKIRLQRFRGRLVDRFKHIWYPMAHISISNWAQGSI